MKSKKEKIKLEKMRFFDLHREPFYEGELVNGKPHGQGKLTFEKFDDKYESSFEGLFEEGIPIEGKFTWGYDGTIFDGKFNKEHSRSGKGRIIYKDGSEYVGEWYLDEKNGQGTMVFSNGTEFTGHWFDDCPSDGVMTYPDGTKFKGGFKHLSYHFEDGEIFYPDGSKFKSEFFAWDETERVKFEGTMFYSNIPNKEGIVEGTLHITHVMQFKYWFGSDYILLPSKTDKFKPKEKS